MVKTYFKVLLLTIAANISIFSMKEDLDVKTINSFQESNCKIHTEYFLNEVTTTFSSSNKGFRKLIKSKNYAGIKNLLINYMTYLKSHIENETIEINEGDLEKILEHFKLIIQSHFEPHAIDCCLYNKKQIIDSLAILTWLAVISTVINVFKIEINNFILSIVCAIYLLFTFSLSAYKKVGAFYTESTRTRKLKAKLLAEIGNLEKIINKINLLQAIPDIESTNFIEENEFHEWQLIESGLD